MKRPRPFRFGVLADRIGSPAYLLSMARSIEQQGFSTLLIRDHVIEYPFGHQLAPFTALAAVATATDRLRLGTMVLSNDYRSPVQVAKEFATLDVLSEGRAECGIGAGFLREEYNQQGIVFDPPAIRVDRLVESLRILKGLFAGVTVSFQGNHYSVENFSGFPAPIQRPHLPLLVAGRGKRMLSVAAREADIIGLQTVTTADGDLTDDPRTRLSETVAGMVDTIRAAAGARFSDLELNSTISLIVTDDRVRAAERLILERGWHGIQVDQVLAMPAVFLGTHDEIAQQMRERRKRFGITYYVVGTADMTLAAPLIKRLATQ